MKTFGNHSRWWNQGGQTQTCYLPKTHVFNHITLTFLYRNIFLNKPNKGKWILVLSASVYSQVEPKEVWLTFLCAGYCWRFAASRSPSSQLPSCSLHLSGSLPDGFCLALSFLGTGTGIRRLLKAKCCCFFPPTGGGLAVQHERRITKGCRGSSAGGGGSVSGTAAPPAQSQSSFFSFFSHFMCCCGILAPRSRMGAEPPAWEALSLHHWTAREVPKGRFWC